MKILLTNQTLYHLAGSETFVFTLALELKRLGHEVHCYSPVLGEISRQLEANGINCDNVIVDEDYDIVHCHHAFPTQYACHRLPDTPKVFVLHGIIGGPETPIKHPSIKKYVAVSPEVFERLKHIYKLESEIVYNAIDFQRFKPSKKRNKKIESILVTNSYVASKDTIMQEFAHACKEFGIKKLYTIGTKFNKLIWDTENVYNDVDLVVSLGRGCLESMACNRPAMVYGHWGCAGIVNRNNINDIRNHNFSGRSHRKQFWDYKRICKEFEKYNNTTDYRKLIEDKHDIKTQAKIFLDIYEEAIKKNHRIT